MILIDIDDDYDESDVFDHIMVDVDFEDGDYDADDEDDNDDEELNGMIFHDVRRKYERVHDDCYYSDKYRGAKHIIYNLRYKTPKEIPVALHNGSNYDNHFTIKQVADEFERKFKYMGNTLRNTHLFQCQKKSKKV